MKLKTLLLVAGIGTAFLMPSHTSFAAEKEKSDKSSTDQAFIRKAAIGGMTEVELGKLAEKNAKKDDVKDFGKQMVKDHGKANDDLKGVASKINATVPDKVNAKHQATIDKFSKLSAEAFDSAYVKEMVKDHEKDIAEFEKASGEVKDADLKKFIDDTIPVMKNHLEMVKKMESAK